MPSEAGLNPDSGKCADHKNFRVCEVDESQNAIDHGVTKGDQNVDQSQAETAQAERPELAGQNGKIH